MPSIRLGCVQYLNTLPLIEGLQAWRDAEIVTAVPSRLINMLLGGEVDVALASVVDAARGVGENGHTPSGSRGARTPSPAAPPSGGGGGCVALLPVGMIGCDGPTMTVRLFSRVPIGEIRSVGVDTDSHTSAVLMQVLLARQYGLRPRVVDFDARERMVVGTTVRALGHETNPPPSPLPLGGGTDALLLIGDKVVTDPPGAGEFPHQLDLGAAWKDLTGLPFVYAVWMCREGEEDSPAVRAAAAMLDRQRRHNATRLGWIVASRASERHWPEDAAAEYVGTLLKYEVGDAEREAVEKFIAWSFELGLCDTRQVRWAEMAP